MSGGLETCFGKCLDPKLIQRNSNMISEFIREHLFNRMENSSPCTMCEWDRTIH